MSENSNQTARFNIGDRVVFSDNERTKALRAEAPFYYPAPGTVGIVVEKSTYPFIQWEDGSTSGNDRWSAAEIDLEPEQAATTAADAVKHPGHYTQDGVECIDAIRASLGGEDFASYCKGNVIKYLWRYRHKNGLEDLGKAKVYLDWLIEAEGGR